MTAMFEPDDLGKAQETFATHLAPFEPAVLPREAFSYRRYMDVYKMSKSDAKKMVQLVQRERVFRNDRYQVNVQFPETSPGFVHLSIKRIDREPIHDWRDLQAIKNMLVGPEHEGIELYPKESRLVDTANQYHLWVLRVRGNILPIGFTERLVLAPGTHDDNSVQRPLPQPITTEENPQ